MDKQITPVVRVILFILYTCFSSAELVAAQLNNQYVGSVICSECHQLQMKQWRGSHHQLAMQHVTDETVPGNFANKEFT